MAHQASGSGSAAGVGLHGRVSTTLAAVVLGAVAPVLLGLAPVMVGAMVTQLGFSPSQAGLAISAHLGGIGLMGLPMTALVQRRVWRSMLLVAMPLLVVLWVLAGFMTQAAALIAVLFAAGLAAGVAVSITLPMMSCSRNPTAAFAWWVVLQLALGSAGVAIAPSVFAAAGIGGMFWLVAAVSALAILLIRHVPAGPEPSSGEAPRGAVLRPSSLLGLGGLMMFYVAVGGAWTYFERIGDASGLNAPFIAMALSAATLCGVLGALLAAFTPARLGQLAPLLAGVFVLLGSLALLFRAPGEPQFLTSALLFKIAWTFTLPFLLGSLSQLDASGRLLVLANIIIGLGLAVGPAAAAAVVREGEYGGVALLSAAGVAGCGLAFLALSARGRT